ncbi:hypothetical protein D3C85_1123640 [compost metagenome]
MQHHPTHRNKIANQGKTRRQQPHRHPIKRMAQLSSTLDHRRVLPMLLGQGEQPVTQGSDRPQQEVPENHRKKTLVRLPQQMPFDPLQQLLATVGADIQVTFGDMGRSLQVFPAPGVAKWAETRQQIAAPQTVNHHQQMHRQRQQPISHRVQHQQQQPQQRNRQQHQHEQNQPWLFRQARAGLEFMQLAHPTAISLNLVAQGRELLDPYRQQQHQKTHCRSSFSTAASASAAR